MNQEVQRINKNELRASMKRMEKGKVVGGMERGQIVQYNRGE